MKRVAIVGAGISGLAFAYYLQKRCPDWSITFMEQERCVGGWLKTCKIGALSYEKGPRFFARHKSPHLLSLIEEMGLEKRLVYAASPRTRFVYQENKLFPLPNSLFHFLRSPLTKHTFMTCLQEWWQKKENLPEETVHAFFLRRFRSEKIARLVAVMAKGIYAADTRHLSMRLSFPALYKAEQEKGSLLQAFFSSPRQDRRLFTLEGGMGELSSSLQKRIKATWHFGVRVEKVQGKVLTTGRGAFEADLIVLALPLSSIKRLLSHPAWNFLPTHPLHVVHMAFRESCVPVQGFGYLTGVGEATPILGAVFDGKMYPQRGEKITMFLGGDAHPELSICPEEKLHALALQGLREHLGITQRPEWIACVKGEEAGVAYRVGHEQHVRSILQSLPSHTLLLGNYLEGVSVDHCIKRAVDQVERAYALL
ncbi:MAG: protoporphyrinogen oxidase [Chlamydiota bacterium]